MEYRIGIIDDDDSKITQLLTYIDLGWNDEDGKLIKEKYKDYKLKPFEIQLEQDIDTMVEKIYDLKPDALIIDFKLASLKSISYSGVQLATAIDERLRDFPVFILTSYEDDLYEKASFDAYQVFNFSRYLNEVDERLEVNSKIVQQIKKYNATVESWKKELIELIKSSGRSATIDDRIIELDSLIENSIDGKSSLPKKTKHELMNTEKLQTLIDKIDILIKKE